VGGRSNAGEHNGSAKAVREKFEGKDGLWIRSIQFKDRVFEKEDFKFDKTQSVAGQRAYSWTYAHQSIPQHFFKMDPEYGQRAVALIVDWRKTADRYVKSASKDICSNGTFGPDVVAKEPRVTKEHMDNMKNQLHRMAKPNGLLNEHNELLTCQIKKKALVGLLWNPIQNPHPSQSPEGGKEWEDSKAKFVELVKTLNVAGAAMNGLPIFAYDLVGSQMVLDYIDFIHPAPRSGGGGGSSEHEAEELEDWGQVDWELEKLFT
jgi:hypothetical protein